jgi:hypothetical protein
MSSFTSNQQQSPSINFFSDTTTTSTATESTTTENINGIEAEWREYEVAALSSSIYCEGYMGFGCEVPLAIKLMREFLINHFEVFPVYCKESIHRLVEQIKQHDIEQPPQIVENNQNTEYQSEKLHRAVGLCQLMYGLRRYCRGDGVTELVESNTYLLTKPINWIIVRDIIENDILSLPQNYLKETKIKSVSSCRMSSSAYWI